MAKKYIIIGSIIALLISGFFFFRYQVYFSHGEGSETEIFEIKKGEGNAEIAANLRQARLISGKLYFYYYVRIHGLLNKFLPGKYELNGQMTIPEIATILTSEENILPGYAKVTFPEGWRIEQMAERLSAKELDGQGFLAIAKKPGAELLAKYAFLKDESDLEGFLFPDTYFFAKDIGAESIVKKMLDNFDARIDQKMRQKMAEQKKSMHDIITLASIIEGEVRSDEDRRIVSGIFWNRLSVGQALQSCATLAYVLGENKKQYTLADTQVQSPYNTYLNPGLPPGPISNPGLSAIQAALNPQDSDYNYFLSDPETGNTIFSKTFEEHNANKLKYGL